MRVFLSSDAESFGHDIKKDFEQTSNELPKWNSLRLAPSESIEMVDFEKIWGANI